MAKHYAISDIHGMYDIYEQVCAMLQPDDVVYFLGDAGDRGYDCFHCIKAIYENPQWIYLKGNHEDLMEKGLREIIHAEEYGFLDNDFDLWMYNGGHSTYDEWMADGADPVWIVRLKKLQLSAEYTNSKGITFHMSHAGFTCGRPEQMWGDELVWSRSHFFNYWDEDNFPNDICIHGHTPLEFLNEEMEWHGNREWKYKYDKPEAHVYCNGHKIDIDNGVFYTKATVIYDLDEMKAIPLFDRHVEQEEADDGTWE